MQRSSVKRCGTLLFLLSLLVATAACGDGDAVTVPAPETDDASPKLEGKSDLDRRVRLLMRTHGVEEPETIDPVDDDVFELGKKLFFDKALSGNEDTACATCHFTTPETSTADGLPLGIGVGGEGTAPNRSLGEHKEHEPRHSIEIFNRGLKGWETQFWDARVQEAPNGELVTPAGDDLLGGLEGVVEAQAMFPVTSRIEMRGEPDDPNPISQVPDGEFEQIWSALMDRLLSFEGYRELFREAYPDKQLDEMTFADAANAIGLWEREAYTFVDSPFDEYLKDDDSALTREQKEGAIIFYGKGGCAECHSGTLTTDQEFHNIAAPQIGPGKGSTKPLDPGRFIVTGRPSQKFEFRTPPLRNCDMTAPYMHSGAYDNIEDAIRHHLDPRQALADYDGSRLPPEVHEQVHNSESVRERLLEGLDGQIRARARIQRQPHHPLRITDRDVDRLVAFLKAMSSPTAEEALPTKAPDSVPSGLLEDGR